MKKHLKRPDGSEETVEGTPEEISEYERISSGKAKVVEQAKRPEVLKGAPIDEEQLREFMEQLERQLNPVVQPIIYPPIFLTSCSRCHRYPCDCMWQWPYGYTVTLGGNSLTVVDVQAEPTSCLTSGD